jgi:hypothetical protein
MRLYSYIVPRDFGFAPNPFNGYCTLATCKPKIRNVARVDDWIMGTGSKSRHNIAGRLIYAMKVTEKMSFNEYWEDPRFQVKKPHMNGSFKQAFGDNIYHYNERKKRWHQENSHHSYENGEINYNNLNRDTEFPFVLISDHFFYLGANHIDIPPSLKGLCMTTQGHKVNHDPKLVERFIRWLEGKYEMPGLKGNPLQFDGFERYYGTKH